jgi:putative hydrolase of the HAD superfamily
LLLLTKGNRDEQQAKLDASQLARHFRSIHIVKEKDVGTYRQLGQEHSLDLAKTWMVGNSPKSDILPARQAGLCTVFIPSAHTWVLEHDDLDARDERVLRLGKSRAARPLLTAGVSPHWAASLF